MVYTLKPVPTPTGLESTNRCWNPSDIDDRHYKLMDSHEDLNFLLIERRLTYETLTKAKIGLYSKGTYMFPVFDDAGRVHNVRYYRRKDGKKWGVKGRTTKFLYPWHMLKPEDDIVWLVEGEIDALIMRQHGVPAISTTAGAPASPATFFRFREVFKGRRFVLAFDNDEPGQKAAAEIGLDVFPDRIAGIVHWPDWCKPGFDVSDWVRSNKSLDDLNESFVKEFDPEVAFGILGRNRKSKTAYSYKPDDNFDLKTMWPKEGFLYNYVNYAQTLTDAPDQFHCATALTLLGTAMKRRTFYWMGSDKIFPNFYSMIVAPSSVYRKSTAMRIGMRLIAKYQKGLIMPREFSSESFIQHLSEEPMGVMAFSEIAELLDQFKKSYSEGLMALLTDFYDCPDFYERRTKKDGKIKIEKPFISILGASTVEWLNSNITQSQAQGGFWPRFLFWSARKRKPVMEIPPMPSTVEFERLAFQLANVVIHEGQVTLSNGAEYRLREWTRKRNNTNGGTLGNDFLKYAARMQPYALKIAMLFQMSSNDGGLLISPGCMEMALKLCDWLLKNLEYLLGFELSWSKQNALENRILSLVRDNPMGVSMRDLSRRFRLGARELDVALNALLLREYIGRQRDDDGVERVFPTADDEQFVSCVQ